MEVATRYTLFTLFILLKLLYTAETLAHVPIYIAILLKEKKMVTLWVRTSKASRPV